MVGAGKFAVHGLENSMAVAVAASKHKVVVVESLAAVVVVAVEPYGIVASVPVAVPSEKASLAAVPFVAVESSDSAWSEAVESSDSASSAADRTGSLLKHSMINFHHQVFAHMV